MVNNPDRRWLVRSSGVVLGPFSLDEMVVGLREKRIAIIDEVRSVHSRWSFIREHPEFADIIQFIREQEAQAKDDTGATFIETKTATASQKTITQTDTEKIDTSANTLRFIEEAKADSVTVNPLIMQKKTVQYGIATDPQVQKQVRRQSSRNSLMAWVLLFLIIGFGAYYISQHPIYTDGSKSLSYEDYMKLAKSNKAIGNFDRSLEFLRKASALGEIDLPGQVIMAPMLMLVENQNIQARRQLEEALKIYKNEDANHLEAESLIALSYLREGQLDEAEKQYQALSAKVPQYLPAEINLVEISILKGDFESAYQNLTKMMREQIKDPVIILYRALVIYRIFEAEKAKEKLNQAIDDVKRFRQKNKDYKPENLLIQAALQKKLGRDAELKATLRELIGTYPDLTKEHLHNYFIHSEILGWKYLANICQILIDSGDKQSLEIKGLQSYCSYQQGDMKTAMDQIDSVSAQYSKESILYGLRAFLLMRSGRLNEAKSIFVLPNSQDSSLLGVVEAQICDKEKDDVCAERAWTRILSKDESNILALTGLAKVSMNNGNKDNAADYVMRAWLKSNNYKPILEIKDQLDQR